MGKAAWFAWAIVALIVLAIGVYILAPESVLPTYSCAANSVIACAKFGLEGIRSYFRSYLPSTILAFGEFALIGGVIVFVALLMYGLMRSREEL